MVVSMMVDMAWHWSWVALEQWCKGMAWSRGCKRELREVRVVRLDLVHLSKISMGTYL